MDDIVAHETTRQIEEVIDVPEHAQRKNASPAFAHAVTQLRADGHYQCWICGSTDDLQVHHLLAEWSLANDIDLGKLWEIMGAIDPYGYAARITTPPTSVDDIRNLVTLCRAHHEEPVTGIHLTTFSAWLSQRLAKDGIVIVPQDRNAIEKLLTAKANASIAPNE